MGSDREIYEQKEKGEAEKRTMRGKKDKTCQRICRGKKPENMRMKVKKNC